MTFTEGALSLLQSYPWPGNIRELGNLVAYLTAMVEGDEIDVADLPPKLRDQALIAVKQSAATSSDGASNQGFYSQVEFFEKGLLEIEYAALSGNVSKLALHLGMDRSHLYSKLKQYRIHPKS